MCDISKTMPETLQFTILSSKQMLKQHINYTFEHIKCVDHVALFSENMRWKAHIYEIIVTYFKYNLWFM